MTVIACRDNLPGQFCASLARLGLWRPLAGAAGGLLLAAASLTALGAPYKVVAPDGTVTYTDRPPAGADPRPVARRSVSDGSAAELAASNGVVLAELPFELRAVVQRYPVLLITGDNCQPCDLGRAALRQRGIPFGERTARSRADLEALQRLDASADLPVLRIGSQRLRGYSGSEWTEYLDAAGYPKASALTSRYRAPAASALAGTPASTPAGQPDTAERTRNAQQTTVPTLPPDPPEVPGQPRLRF